MSRVGFLNSIDGQKSYTIGQFSILFIQKIILSRLRRFYLIICLYIYEFCIRKRKKLTIALTKLKTLNLKNPEIKKDLDNLSNQKNQLEIEKQDLEQKYKSLKDDYNNLSEKLDELQNKEKVEQKKQIEFAEKIDELNQETDTLLSEIDKWQT